MHTYMHAYAYICTVHTPALRVEAVVMPANLHSRPDDGFSPGAVFTMISSHASEFIGRS